MKGMNVQNIFTAISILEKMSMAGCGSNCVYTVPVNTVMTLLNDFPLCLGLDELYRQMRVSQETLRCCTTWIQTIQCFQGQNKL